MRIITILTFILIIHTGCQQSSNKALLTRSNIASQYFTIDGGKDQLVRTAHGTLLNIKAGTFRPGQSISLEIKEVFTPDEILRSGINTTSNGRLLKSAGMLYFSATSNGQAVTPSLPVSTTIPTMRIDPDMKIFDGEIGEDSLINWVNPRPLDTVPAFEDYILHGRLLFETRCRTCHSIFRDGTGPALAGFESRGPWSNPLNVKAWLNNPARFMAGSSYAQNLKSRYGSVMAAYPALTLDDVAFLTAYINSTNAAPSYTGVNDTSKASPCLDTSYSQVMDMATEYDTSIAPLEGITDTTMHEDTVELRRLIAEYRRMTRRGYSFEITANGWYNVDAFMDDSADDLKPTKLTVAINSPEKFASRVYLFIPNSKVLQEFYDRDGDAYSFGDKLRLPHGERAVVFATGDIDHRVYYGVKEFTIAASHQLTLDMQETTAEKLQNVLASKNINGVSITATKLERRIDTLPCFDGIELSRTLTDSSAR